MQPTELNTRAIQMIRKSVKSGVLLASAEAGDNYTHVWARDCAVTGLGILTAGVHELYGSFRSSLLALQKAANGLGQIPSNVRIDENGEPDKISFGGPVGRSDASFWWLIGSIGYLKHQEDQEFSALVKHQSMLIFKLAEAWEFNGKHLMYLPMSGNWADEYITHGYVLYDQLLRYWALSMAADFFEDRTWAEKAAQIKAAIKQHYLFERPLNGSLYTNAQQAALAGYSLDKNFIASFSPGDRVERYDGWSISLLMLLNIPSPESMDKLATKLEEIMAYTKNQGIPAFWPEIRSDEPIYQQLLNNHSFAFKNKPGHFHNGGIWPVVNGFLVAGLHVIGKAELAEKLNKALVAKLSDSMDKNPFAEYYDLYNGAAGGVKNLCFSASGLLIANTALADIDRIAALLPSSVEKQLVTNRRFTACASAIIEHLNLTRQKVLVISIAGESGAGKTTLASSMKQCFDDMGISSILLHQDDYFKLPPRKNTEARLLNFEHVGYGEVDTERLNSDLRTIAQQQFSKIAIPKMNWLTDDCETVEKDVKDVRVIILEGTYTLLPKEVDFRIFINTNYKQTLENRHQRSRETIDDFTDKILHKESGLVQAQEPLADLIVNSRLDITKTEKKI